MDASGLSGETREMKILKYIIWAILLIYFQILIAPKFTLLGTIPNFFLPFIVFLGIYSEFRFSIHIAFFSGLALDLVYPYLLGFNSILFVLLIYFTAKHHNSLNKDKFAIVALSMLAINIIYYFLLWFMNILYATAIPGLFSSGLFTILYNTVISILFLYLISFADKIKFYLNV
jgi:rod shape-determining protein MreD